MRTLDEALEISIERKGGEDAVFDSFEPSKSSGSIAAIPGDRKLAKMTPRDLPSRLQLESCPPNVVGF
ncbi:hypothetical protein GCM10007385_45330 [Tateyamaria omphalii]|uniref:hypothetical protein n=1 Tax=Tateyamaria omphalii TaxID=299262 RepID=UPI0016753897|nr:hypothetical protein [Tateyamaria omphalii]GGX71260.1 hypothetical protein GCM10007385_45330 [Tateyamaria omphalii]